MNTNKTEILKMISDDDFSYAYRAVVVGNEDKKWIDYDPVTMEEGRKTSLQTILDYEPSLFLHEGYGCKPACPVIYPPKDLTVIKAPVSKIQEYIERFSTLTLVSSKFVYFFFKGNGEEFDMSGYELVPEDEAIPVMALYDDRSATTPSILDLYFYKRRVISEAEQIISDAVDEGLKNLHAQLDSIFEKDANKETLDTSDESILEEVPKVLRAMFEDDALLVVQEIRNSNENGAFLKVEDILEDQDLKESCLAGMNRSISRWFCKDGEEFKIIAKYAGDGIIPDPLLPDDQKEAFQRLLSTGVPPKDLLRCKEIEDKEEVLAQGEKILDSLSSGIPGVYESIDEGREDLMVFIGETKLHNAEEELELDLEEIIMPGVDHDARESFDDFCLIGDEDVEDQIDSFDLTSDDEVLSQTSFLDDNPEPALILPEPEESSDIQSEDTIFLEQEMDTNIESEEALSKKKEEKLDSVIIGNSKYRKIESLKSKIGGGLFKTICSTYKGFTEKALLEEGSLFLDATGREDRYKSRAIMLEVNTSKSYYSCFDTFDSLLQMIEESSSPSVYIYGLNCLDPISRSEALRLRRAAHKREIRVTVFGDLTENDCAEMFD